MDPDGLSDADMLVLIKYELRSNLFNFSGLGIDFKSAANTNFFELKSIHGLLDVVISCLECGTQRIGYEVYFSDRILGYLIKIDKNIARLRAARDSIQKEYEIMGDPALEPLIKKMDDVILYFGTKSIQIADQTKIILQQTTPATFLEQVYILKAI